MIYVDTSVALAELLAEDRRPGEHFWNETLVSSRLLEYELWSACMRAGWRGATATRPEPSWAASPCWSWSRPS